MKRIILILSVLFAAVSTARAQYDHPNYMGTVGLSYNPIFNTLTLNGNPDKAYFNGFGFSWTNAHSVSKNKPFYVGYGLGIQYASNVEKDETRRELTQNLSLKLPVEMLYRYEYLDTDFLIIPHIGVDFNFYPMYRVVSTFTDNDKTEVLDMYSVEFVEGAHINRVTIGLHVGARFQVDHFFLDLSYELPAMGFFYSKLNTLYDRQIHVTAGYAF